MSTERQKEHGNSIEVQKKYAEKYLKKNNLEKYRIIKEAKSASKIQDATNLNEYNLSDALKNRPGLSDILKMAKEKKFKQVVEFLVTNSIDPQTGNPHTAERIKSALEQAHVNIKSEPVENQMNDIIAEISKIIPIIKKKVSARIKSLAEPVRSIIHANIRGPNTEASFVLMP
mgnify:CR=1 FL=1